MRLAKTTIVHFISQSGKAAAGFIITLYLARTVGAGVLGEYFVVVALVTWFTVPGNGISNAMTKRISEGEDKGEYLTSAFVMNAVVLVFISAILMVFQEQVESYIGAPVLYLLIYLLIAQSLFKHVNAGLNGQKMVAKAGIIQFFERILRGGTQIGLVYLGYELGGILAGHITSLLVLCLTGYLLYDISFSIPEKHHFRSLASYARYSWLGSMKSRTFGWMDTIILNFFVVSSVIGVYEIAWRLASFLVILSVSISTAIFPEISEVSSDNKYDEVHSILSDSLAFSGMFVIPGFVGALVLGPELLRIYGTEFTQGNVVLLVLIAARGIGAYEKALTQTINAINRPDIAFRINLILISTNLFFNVVLVYLFGWYGAAFATTASILITLLMAYRGISKTIGRPNIPSGEVSKQVLASIIMGGVIYILSGFGSSMLFTVALVGIGAVIYGVCLTALSKRFKDKIISLTP